MINHLQDCGKDYLALNRVYIPTEALAKAGASVEELSGTSASPALLSVINALARKTLTLLETSAPFASLIRDGRLAAEVAIIQRLAESLTARLLERDPLSQRVHHNGPEVALLGVGAIVGHLFRRHAA